VYADSPLRPTRFAPHQAMSPLERDLPPSVIRAAGRRRRTSGRLRRCSRTQGTSSTRRRSPTAMGLRNPA